MESMISKTSRKVVRAAKGFAKRYDAFSPSSKAITHAALTCALLALPEVAFAQSGNGGILCNIAQYMKGIVGTCALLVIVLWAIEHFFGVSKLHDVLIKVGVGAAIVSGATVFIANSGLSSSCLI